MIICYLAAICPEKIFHELESEVSVAAYQFNKLLAEGLASIDNVDVKCLVPISLLRRMDSIDWNQKIECNGVQYSLFGEDIVKAGYISFIIKAQREIRKWKKKDDVVVIADGLGIVSDILSVIVNIFYGIQTIGIITDLPQFVGTISNWKEKIRCKINLIFMRRFCGYILLTEKMSEWVNRKKRPQCIVEGICDGKQILNETPDCKYDKQVCMYAGSLHEEYGIAMLIDAFLKANVNNSELHIYGKGNYSNKIEELCEKYKNVIYHGQCAHEYILREEKKVTLLINPRPTHEEYTKYSFPSKTLEYMASGTPVLMTKLSGMPVDYYPYVFLFEEETVDGYAKKIKEVLELQDGLEDMGKLARKFILQTRNNKVVAKRIVEDLINRN